MRRAEIRIIPECYVDSKVTEIAGQSSKKYNHQHGCGNVASELIRLKNEVCIGIIDEDKNKGPKARYFDEFVLVKEENSLILKRHKQHSQYLMLICPEIEKWLMNDANAVSIDPRDYQLPTDLKDFTSISKIQDIDRNEGFYRFVKKLMKENAPAITTLRNWLTLFKLDQLTNLS